jgi:hypothetical protein
LQKDPKDIIDEIRDRWPSPEKPKSRTFWCPKKWRSPKDELTKT